jgi:hypothetical protein
LGELTLNEAADGCDCEPLSSMKKPSTTTAVNNARLNVNMMLTVEGRSERRESAENGDRSDVD